MLVRRPRGAPECAIHQEQHALVSGVLAAAWMPALDPRLVMAIGLHDMPWRSIDATPRRDAAGALVDFVAFPIAERLVFYADGITQAEAVDPYVAYMISLHYSAFVGTRDLEGFTRAEQARRERLAPLLGERVARAHEELRWLQFFDVLSLYVCLAGPDVADDVLPVWLRDVARWSTPPDGRELSLGWSSRDVVEVSPWPFRGDALAIDVAMTADGAAEAHVRTVTALAPSRRRPPERR